MISNMSEDTIREQESNSTLSPEPSIYIAASRNSNFRTGIRLSMLLKITFQLLAVTAK